MANVVLPLGPALLDITGVRAGDRNLITLTLTSGGTPMDLTGLTPAAQARLNPMDANALTAVTEVVDAVGGVVTVRWPGEAVRTILAGKAAWTGVWDLQIGAPGEDPVTVVAGAFAAVMDVTRTDGELVLRRR